MKEFIRPISLKLNPDIISTYSQEEILYFDIETTGFAPEKSTLYLIGCVYFENGEYFSRQWFVDEPAFEMEAIDAFMEFIKGFKALVHYNGNGFDIPYITKKCAQYNITNNFALLESIDIYKKISIFKALFKTPDIKQKTMEQFLKIHREDKYNGGELIKVYNTYCQKPSDELLRLLLLHNHNDLTGMLGILPLLNYSCLLENEYTLSGIVMNELIDKKEVVITLETTKPLPSRVSMGNNNYYFIGFEHTVKICVHVYTEELKFFYPNYKDYYYLPEEDRSIHKSVAFYVDKNFRTKAKAANCYSKKTGTFLPQYKEVITPYFRIDFYDKISYFEYIPEFFEDKDAVLQYCNQIFETLLT